MVTTSMAAYVINQTCIHPFSDTIQTLYSLSLLLKCVLTSQLKFIELYELM